MLDRSRLLGVLAAFALACSLTVVAPAAQAGSTGRSGPISWRTGQWQGHNTIFVTNHGTRTVRVKCTWARYYSDSFRLRPHRTHKVWAMASTRNLECWVRR